MTGHRLRYRKALRDKESKLSLEVSNSLHDLLLKKNFNNFWKSWKHKFGNKNTNADICTDGMLDSTAIAAQFANFFENVCSVEQSRSSIEAKNKFALLFDEYRSVSNSTSDFVIDASMVDRIVIDMKGGKAAGIDDLMAEHLKFSHPVIIIILKKLFNLVLKSGFVPTDFGRGLIIPIHKKRSNCNFACIKDFRGITISPVISKVFELCLVELFGEFLSSSSFNLVLKRERV